MRPGQNKRMRGRNNNRRGPNPLTRSYESNGPDVKIRGTAAHVAEKYVQLARDAHASGDPVAAESYLQHAEHYLRLIAAAQQAQAQQQQQGSSTARVDDADEGYDGDDEFESSVMDRFTFRAPQAPVPPGFQPEANGEQPRAEYAPREHQPREHQPREHQPREHQPREHRNNGEFRRERGQGDRGQGERGPSERPQGEFRRDRNFDRGQPRFERPQPQPDLVESDTGLPPFITAPVRIPIETPNPIALAEQPDIGDVPVAGADDEFARAAAARPRRRRTRRGPRDEMGGADEAPQTQDAPTE